MHVLFREWHDLRVEQLLAYLGEAAPIEGHLERASGRPYGLGGQARKGDAHALLCWRCADRSAGIHPDTRIGVRVPEGTGAVEDAVGPAVPEVREVEDRVDNGRSIARLDAAGVGAAHVEHRVGYGTALLDRSDQRLADVGGVVHPRRGDDVDRKSTRLNSSH